MERRQTYRNEKSVVEILKRALLSVTVLCDEEKLLLCWVLVGNYPGARHLQSYFVPSHHGAFGSLRGLSPGHLPSKAQKGEGEREREKSAKGKRGPLSPIPPSLLPPPPPPQATRIYNLIYGRPGTNLPSIAFLFNLMLYRTIAAGIRQEINVVWKNSLLCGPSPPPCLGISC